MSFVTLLGFTAALLGIISFLPQVVRSWRTKSTRDISLPMFLLLAIAAVLWSVYGILRSDLPVLLINGVNLISLVSMVYLKLKHG